MNEYLASVTPADGGTQTVTIEASSAAWAKVKLVNMGYIVHWIAYSPASELQ